MQRLSCFFLFLGLLSCAIVQVVSAEGLPSVAPVQALAKRVLGESAAQFDFVIDPQLAVDRGRKIRITPKADGRIQISGDSLMSLNAGLHLYLKRVAKAHVSWAHDQLSSLNPLPRPEAMLEYATEQRHATAFNYCTFSYTMPWWTWERWEKEIDFLALYGVDSPLAIVGTEEIWLRVLQRFNYTREEALKFPAGPAYTAWWLMGNCQGVGGPVNEAFVASRVALQQKILARMRELGMRPVLQGFVGIVPLDLAENNPSAKLLDQGAWCGVPRPPVLHPDDPLFELVGRAWYEELEKLYGKVDVFAGDLFHEGGKTHGIDISKMAGKVQRLMRGANPDAIWSLQGWSGNPSSSLLKGLDPKNTEVVELCNEFFQNWKSSKGFHGKPWYFGSIVQYGGNVGLHGRLPFLWKNFKEANDSDTSPIGVGLTWESTGINPVAADLVIDMQWAPQEVSLHDWVSAYAARRYGESHEGVNQALQLLLRSCYGEFPNHRRPTESVFCARPGPNVQQASPFAASVYPPYDVKELAKAVQLLVDAAPQFAKQATYRHDLVDVTRQFLASLGLIAYKEMATAGEKGDKGAFLTASQTFLSLLMTQDELLASEKDFLLGPWLLSARQMAPKGEEDAYEFQARSLISTWFPSRTPGSLADYSWREWSGLLKSYYLPRWEGYIAAELKRLDKVAQGENIKTQGFNTSQMDIDWAKKTMKEDPYPTKPVGDSVSRAKNALSVWMPWFLKNNRAELLKPKSVKAQESAKDAR